MNAQRTTFLTDHLAGQVVLATAPEDDNSILLMYSDNRVARFFVTPEGEIGFLLTELQQEH